MTFTQWFRTLTASQKREAASAVRTTTNVLYQIAGGAGLSVKRAQALSEFSRRPDVLDTTGTILTLDSFVTSEETDAPGAYMISAGRTKQQAATSHNG